VLSSRRRHTRYSRDWSSDVCSSDLAFDRDEQIVGAIRAGAEGYLLKGAPRGEVFHAIRVVHGGGSLIEPVIASKLLRQVREEKISVECRGGIVHGCKLHTLVRIQCC